MDSFAASDAQFLEQPRQSGVQCALAKSTGFLHKRTSQSCFPTPVGPEMSRGCPRSDPLTMAQAVDESRIVAETDAGIEVFYARLKSTHRLALR